MHSTPPAERATFATDTDAHPTGDGDSVRILSASAPSGESRAGTTGIRQLTELLVSRTVTVIFRRDPSRDRQGEQRQYQGYQLLWQDGQPATVGLDSFCRHGLRFLGLNRYLGHRHEAVIELQCVSLPGRDAPLTRLPGCRTRRFFLKRAGLEGRLHFLDGTPTATTFQLDRDEARVLDWVGLSSLADGACQWLDLGARVLEADSATAP